MDNLDPRSIRKGSKIRLEDGDEADASYVNGIVNHVNERGLVIIEYIGIFAVDGLTPFPSKGYHRFQLAKHTLPKLESKPGTIGKAKVRCRDGATTVAGA